MKALLVGLGGIGSNVYYPELCRLGYDVTTVDQANENANYKSVEDVDNTFDVAVICTPNFTHQSIAQDIAPLCKVVFIEKPGLPSGDQWLDLVDTFPKTKFLMCKNNLYRQYFGAMENVLQSRNMKPTSIEVNWMNDDRVPAPGSWFTNKRTAWGGVALDLFPHLYCHLSKIVPLEELDRTHHTMLQQWELADLTTSDYGDVNKDGVYDVCDYAEETLVWANNIPVKIKASWKSGVNDQSIRVHTTDSTFEWRFGLCPAYAYGNMIKAGIEENYDRHIVLDHWIHKQLEVYHEG